MKILLITDYYYPSVGGAETLYQELAQSLALAHDVIVLTQHQPGTLAEEFLHGVRIVRVATWHRATFPHQAFARARELLKDVDIIQAATYSSAVLAARLKRFTNAKLVLIAHEYLSTRWLHLGVAGIQAFLYEKYVFYFQFDHYIAVSHSTKLQLIKSGIAKHKISIIYNGIDSALFVPQLAPPNFRHTLNISNQARLFLFAGRPGITKGGRLLIRAWERANLPKDAVLLKILGNEPIKERKQLVQLGSQLAPNVKIIASVAREILPHYMAMADVITVPSITEGFGFFAAEACAMGLPVVITPVDALPEVVSGQVIVSQRVTIDSYALALQEAYHGNFQVVPEKKFAWSHTVAEYEKLYLNLLK